MASLLSPGVIVKETDFSGIIPNVATGIGAIAGRFTKGPVDTPILVSTESELLSVFGPPTESNYLEWFSAAQFLQYTNKLWAVRSKPSGSSNAYAATGTVTGTVSLSNDSDYDSNISAVDTDVKFIVKQLGASGNQLGIIVVDNSNWSAFKTWADGLVTAGAMSVSFASTLQYQPDTTSYVSKYAGSSKYDEVHVIIFDAYGFITGTKYQILEVFRGLSKASDALDFNNQSIYYPNVINTQSKYIWTGPSNLGTSANGTTLFDVGSQTLSVTPSTASFAPFNFSFSNPASSSPSTVGYAAVFNTGVDGTVATESDVLASYNLFVNKELYDVGMFISAGYNQVTTLQGIINVAATRQDGIAFFSPMKLGTYAIITDRSSTATTDIIAWKSALNIPETQASYGFFDSGYKYIFDKYNAKYRWIPLNGDTAGLSAQVERLAEAWYSPSGFNRGGIKNVIKLAFNPTDPQRDILYPQSINPVVSFPGQGVVLYGDKTMTLKPSAFDRINVRRLFIILEKAISLAAKYQLFEFNDSFTQAQFRNMVEPYLRDIQGRRGITDFKVICDSSNNTATVVDSNQFKASILVKPSRSINWITLNFVASRSDVQFSTITGI